MFVRIITYNHFYKTYYVRTHICIENEVIVIVNVKDKN